MRASQDVSIALKRRCTCCCGTRVTVAQAVSVVSATRRCQLAGVSSESAPSVMAPLVHRPYIMTIPADSGSTATPVRRGQSTALLAARHWDVFAHSIRGDSVHFVSETRSLPTNQFFGTASSHSGLRHFGIAARWTRRTCRCHMKMSDRCWSVFAGSLGRNLTLLQLLGEPCQNFE